MFIMFVVGIIVSPILTWGFDVNEMIWMGAWAFTATMLLGTFVDGATALTAGIVGFAVLAILLTVFRGWGGDDNSRSEHGFTRKESECLQYQAMGYREAYRSNNCAEVLRNAR